MGGAVRVLVVEDDPAIARSYARALRSAGYEVDACESIADAEDALEVRPYDLIVLDRGLPDGDGLSICRTARAAGNPVPVIVVTGREDEDALVDGLRCGADDYVVKPASEAVLSARAMAVLRRAGVDVIAAGPFRVDRARRRLTLIEPNGALRAVALTASESRALFTLASHADAIVELDRLVEAMWGAQADVSKNAVEAAVKRLRVKLGGLASHLVNQRGAGYMLRTTVVASEGSGVGSATSGTRKAVPAVEAAPGAPDSAPDSSSGRRAG